MPNIFTKPYSNLHHKPFPNLYPNLYPKPGISNVRLCTAFGKLEGFYVALFLLQNFSVSYLKEYLWSSLDFRHETVTFSGGAGVKQIFSSGHAGRVLDTPALKP